VIWIVEIPCCTHGRLLAFDCAEQAIRHLDGARRLGWMVAIWPM
jgi:hypothetical protein